MQWWLFVLAFVLGALLTWIYVIQRATREVRIIQEVPAQDAGDATLGAAAAAAGGATLAASDDEYDDYEESPATTYDVAPATHADDDVAAGSVSDEVDTNVLPVAAATSTEPLANEALNLDAETPGDQPYALDEEQVFDLDAVQSQPVAEPEPIAAAAAGVIDLDDQGGAQGIDLDAEGGLDLDEADSQAEDAAPASLDLDAEGGFDLDAEDSAPVTKPEPMAAATADAIDLDDQGLDLDAEGGLDLDATDAAPLADSEQVVDVEPAVEGVDVSTAPAPLDLDAEGGLDLDEAGAQAYAEPEPAVAISVGVLDLDDQGLDLDAEGGLDLDATDAAPLADSEQVVDVEPAVEGVDVWAAPAALDLDAEGSLDLDEAGAQAYAEPESAVATSVGVLDLDDHGLDVDAADSGAEVEPAVEPEPAFDAEPVFEAEPAVAAEPVAQDVDIAAPAEFAPSIKGGLDLDSAEEADGPVAFEAEVAPDVAPQVEPELEYAPAEDLDVAGVGAPAVLDVDSDDVQAFDAETATDAAALQPDVEPEALSTPVTDLDTEVPTPGAALPITAPSYDADYPQDVLAEPAIETASDEIALAPEEIEDLAVEDEAPVPTEAQLAEDIDIESADLDLADANLPGAPAGPEPTGGEPEFAEPEPEPEREPVFEVEPEPEREPVFEVEPASEVEPMPAALADVADSEVPAELASPSEGADTQAASALVDTDSTAIAEPAAPESSAEPQAEPQEPVRDFGPGSAAPDADGSGPAGWEIKGNASSMLFHTPDSPAYERTKAEVWFVDEAAATGAGFRAWDWRQRRKAEKAERNKAKSEPTREPGNDAAAGAGAAAATPASQGGPAAVQFLAPSDPATGSAPATLTGLELDESTAPATATSQAAPAASASSDRSAAPAPALLDVPPGPYGVGSAAAGPRGKGPEGWTVKGNADSMLYHSPESPWFKRTRAEVWFVDEASAEAAGFARWDSASSEE